MKKTDFLEAMNKVDQKYVAESINYKKSTKIIKKILQF